MTISANLEITKKVQVLNLKQLSKSSAQMRISLCINCLDNVHSHNLIMYTHQKSMASNLTIIVGYLKGLKKRDPSMCKHAQYAFMHLSEPFV